MAAAGALLGLDADVWARLSPLLDEALALPPDARAAWLDGLAPEHAALRPRLQRLLGRRGRSLAAVARVDDSLGARDAGDAGTDAPADAPPRRKAGDVLGGWRLLRPLGEGGMGVVWSASRADGLLDRPVALKLPHAGSLNAGLVPRMARERRILAALAHPHIARLYDAGIAADGQPWLALEHVDGERIDRYCDAHALGVPARLRLFLQVLRAVAHAHAQLVVHRDLKPSNLLVDGQGQVKLLDFGIAKLLGDDDLELTARAGRVMTAGYASPEQVAGQPVGTRSDVYALGVLLYELLAGTGPYRTTRRTRSALEEAVLVQEPRRPSDAAAGKALRRALRGDLDTIVLKALKKAPDERYATVDALADDIERHLAHRPLLARPDSRWRALQKLVRRNRLSFSAGGAALCALVAGSALALWQAQVARAESQRAEQVKDFVVGMLRDASPYRGSDAAGLTALDLLRRAAERLEHAPIGAPDVRAEIGNLLGESLLVLGDVDRAEATLASARAEARSTLGERHPQTLAARLMWAQVQRTRGRVDVQQRELAELLPLARAGGAADPALLVVALQHAALNAIDRGAHAEAEAAAMEGRRLAVATLGERHAETVASSILLALAHRYTGRFEASRQAAEQALALARSVYPGPGVHPRVTEAQVVFGRALADVGDLAGGVAQLRAAIDDAKAVLGAESQQIGIYQQNLVSYLLDLGDLQAADEASVQALRIIGKHARPGSYLLTVAEFSRGHALLVQRRVADALALLGPARAALSQSLGSGHDMVLGAAAVHALALAQAGRLVEARQRLSEMAGPLTAPGVSATTRARAAHAGAVVERMAGDPATAVQRLQPLLADADPAPRLQRERMRGRVELGLSLLALQRPAEAAVAFEAALSEQARLERGATPVRADAVTGLSRALTDLGRRADAAAVLARSRPPSTP